METLRNMHNLTNGRVTSMERLPNQPSTKCVEYSNFSFDGNITDLEKLSHTPSIQEVEFDFFINNNLPAFCIMLILCVVGTIGNIHTILVYTLDKEMKKLSPSTLIVWLSSVDLILSTVCMPFEMYALRRGFSLTNDGACKFSRYLSHALAMMSGMLLVTLARERYSKAPGYKSKLACLSGLVCARQLKMQSKKIQHSCACIVILLISFSFTSPLLVFLGIEKFDHLGTCVMECTVLIQYRGKMTAGVYGGCFAFLGLVCIVYCSDCYVKIILLMHKQSKQYKIRQNKQSNTNLTTFKNSTEAHTEGKIGSYDVNTRKQTSKAKDRIEKGIRLTWSFIVASFVSWIGVIVFVIGAVIRGSDPEFEIRIRIITAVLVRSFFF